MEREGGTVKVSMEREGELREDRRKGHRCKVRTINRFPCSLRGKERCMEGEMARMEE